MAITLVTVKDHPEDVKALVAGLEKAHEYLLANQDKAYAIMAKGVGGWLSDPKDFAASAAGVQFYGKARNAEFFKDGATGEAGKLVTLGGEIWGGQYCCLAQPYRLHSNYMNYSLPASLHTLYNLYRMMFGCYHFADFHR